MKTLKCSIITATVAAAISLQAAEPAGPTPSTAPQNTASATTNSTAPATLEPAPAPKESATNSAPASDETAKAVSVSEAKANGDTGTNALRMNFHGASLDMVLNYLSEAAGFIINIKPGTSVRGKVDVWSNDLLTREEALDLLDTVLNQNGLAAIRNGRTLTIVNRDEAKTQNVPVMQGGDPEKIPATDKIVTQIIPVRFVDVTQLLKDLQPLVSMQTSMTANEAGNAIVITDTQANIRKVAEVIHAIDMGAEDVTVVKVFHLQHADPSETADLLSNLFPDDTRTGNNQQNPFQFGGPGGFFRRMMAGGGGPGGGGAGGANTGGAQNQRIRKRNRVVAVADQRTSSVVVTATKDLMDQIEGVIAELDPDPANTQAVAVFRMQNAEPQEAMQVLQDMFNKNTTTQNTRNNAQNQNNPLQTRSSTQNQQNTSNTRTTGMTPNSRGGGGLGSFGQ